MSSILYKATKIRNYQRGNQKLPKGKTDKRANNDIQNTTHNNNIESH